MDLLKVKSEREKYRSYQQTDKKTKHTTKPPLPQKEKSKESKQQTMKTKCHDKNSKPRDWGEGVAVVEMYNIIKRDKIFSMAKNIC